MTTTTPPRRRVSRRTNEYGTRMIVLRVKRDGLAQRVLQGVTLNETSDLDRAVRSRFVYSPGPDGYRLSLLGFLHGLTGFTLWVEP